MSCCGLTGVRKGIGCEEVTEMARRWGMGRARRGEVLEKNKGHSTLLKKYIQPKDTKLSGFEIIVCRRRINIRK